MNVNRLRVGNKIIIQGKRYDVVAMQNDATVSETGDNELFVAIYLHEFGSKSLQPTHMLANYIEKSNVFFLCLTGDKKEVEINPETIEL